MADSDSKWYYNSKTGNIGQQNKYLMEAYLHLGIGWHGPFDTQQAAMDYYNSGKGNNPGWKAPTASVGGKIKNAVGSGIDTVLGTDQVNTQSWFLRIGEIVLGLVLVGVGIAKLTNTTNAIAKIAKTKI